jgi:hypothetical protein
VEELRLGWLSGKRRLSPGNSYNQLHSSDKSDRVHALACADLGKGKRWEGGREEIIQVNSMDTRYRIYMFFLPPSVE